MRKAFIFRGGAKLDERSKPLKYLDNSLGKIGELLKANDWEVDSFVLDNANNISQKLNNLKDDDNNEVLIVYIGHGVPLGNLKYAFVDINEDEIYFDNIIIPISRFKLTRFSIIIDACHSDQAIDAIPTVDNIELVTSVFRGLAYENKGYKATVFAHFFVEAIEKCSKYYGQEIYLEDICNYFNSLDITQKPTRVSSLHTQFTKPIAIAYSKTSCLEVKINSIHGTNWTNNYFVDFNLINNCNDSIIVKDLVVHMKCIEEVTKLKEISNGAPVVPIKGYVRLDDKIQDYKITFMHNNEEISQFFYDDTRKFDNILIEIEGQQGYMYQCCISMHYYFFKEYNIVHSLKSDSFELIYYFTSATKILERLSQQ